MTTVAASGLATIPLQKWQGFRFAGRNQKRNRYPFLGLASAVTTAASRCSRAAAARFRGRSEHGTLR